MERLAELDGGILQPVAQVSVEKRRPKPGRRSFRTSFGFGFASSGVVGGAALLFLLFVHPDGPQFTTTLTMPEAKASLAPWWFGTAPAPHLTSADGLDEPPALDIAIRRAEQANAPFPLYVTGSAGPPAGVKVTLRDVPETMWLSRGRRQDGGTWVLRLDDLDGLYSSLAEGAQSTFAIKIEVSTSAEVVAEAVVRVRLLDEPSAPHRSGALNEASPLAPPAKNTSTAERTGLPLPAETLPASRTGSGKTTARHVEARGKLVVADANALPAPRPARRLPTTQWPEGASGLGGLARAQAADERQMWWKMPLPSWAPFADPSRKL